MNVFSFTGNLGKDCEIKSTQGGTTVCEFSVAVTSGYGDNKKTTWVSCALFGKRAEGKLQEYLVKGQSVAVSGEASLEQWENNGKAGAKVKVNVNSVDLIGGRAESQQAPQQAPPQQAQQAPPQQAPADSFDDFEDDIPFS